MEEDGKPRPKLNARMLRRLAVVAVMMFGFGYVLVPIYREVCQLTGLNQLTKDQDDKPVGNTQIDLSRTITVEFDANAQGPFRFRPAVPSMRIHPGQLNTVLYEVVNKQGRPVDAQAIPSYAPQQAASHFKKIECFCFRQQRLEANQAKEMPVVFYVDKGLPRDVKTITLSYTFFEVGGGGVVGKAGN